MIQTIINPSFVLSLSLHSVNMGPRNVNIRLRKRKHMLPGKPGSDSKGVNIGRLWRSEALQKTKREQALG